MSTTMSHTQGEPGLSAEQIKALEIVLWHYGNDPVVQCLRPLIAADRRLTAEQGGADRVRQRGPEGNLEEYAPRPVAWRHNLTHSLHDTEEEVQLADADSWAEPLYLSPSEPSNTELRRAAQAVVDRWDTPLWKHTPSTAVFIGRLRAALTTQPQEPATPRYRAQPPDYKVQTGTWELRAPDGTSWHESSPMKCLQAEQHDRIPTSVALARIFAAVDDDAPTAQPQAIIDPAVIPPRDCSITEGPRDRDRQAAQPQAEPAETFARLCEGEGTNPRWSEQQKAVATHLAALIRRATPTAQPQAAEPADPRGTHAEKYFTDEGISRIADLAALKAPEAPATIDTGDHVRHEPSGEEWLVAYVRGDRLVCCGWPESMAALSDCTLVKKATRSDRRALLGQMVGIGGSRDAYAREALKAEPEAVKFVREPRYIVIKIKDLFAYGANEDVHALQVIGDTIAGGRAADGKPPFNAVVVEQDWPEFEPTWAAIEARMTA